MPDDRSIDRTTALRPSGVTTSVPPEEAVASFLVMIGVKDCEAIEAIRRSLLETKFSQESIDEAFEQWLRSSEQTLPLKQSATTEANVEKPANELGETVTVSPETDAFQDTLAHRSDFTAKGGATTGLFGDYEILGEIAKGGMGVVYKARQTKLNRIVALKMIKSAELADAEQVKRFYTEAEAAAKLRHPGIVPVYDVGEANGQHYFSMAFVDGESLSDRVKRDGPLDATRSGTADEGSSRSGRARPPG